MNFLNCGKGYVFYEYESHKDAYVDKSLMVQTVYNHARRTNRYICVARPRRYSKVLLVGINYSARTKKHTCLTELVVQ